MPSKSQSDFSRRYKEVGQTPWFGTGSRILLRRLGWLVVVVGAAYCVLVLTWIALDPRW
jgi:hypothetical protein